MANLIKRVVNNVNRNKSVKDIIILLACGLLASALSVGFDIFERFVGFSKKYEWCQIDEIISISVITSVALAFFSIRRWQEFKDINKKLRSTSYMDELTGLNNRRGFFILAQKQLQIADLKRKPVGMFFVDLDRFKAVNDTLGHGIGDILLQMVAQRLKDCLLEHDTLARLGGDEFLIIKPDVDKYAAEVAARKIISAFSEPFLIEKFELLVTPSMGISLYPFDGDDLEGIIQKADLAMYEAKKNIGEKYMFYVEQMGSTVSKSRILENDLKKALEREEFTLYYQPQMDINANRIIGVEALLRWIRPEKGIISPGEFIPLAEKTGLIIPIGEWVLLNACKQSKKWQDEGHAPILMSVNISVCQLQSNDFLNVVLKILVETKLDPKYLVLEITESVAANLNQQLISVLNQLSQIGIQIAIDDFGTGYSSLQYLKELPIGHLKIDRSFVQNISLNLKDEIIISTIIGMGHNLKLGIVAEGVEKAEDLAFLNQHNCDTVQGYLVGKPVPPDEVIKYMN